MNNKILKLVLNYVIIIFALIGVYSTTKFIVTKVTTKTIDYDDLDGVVYIGREGCGFCQLFVPGLNYLSQKYNFKYEYIDTDKITDEDLEKLLDKMGIDIKEFGTPTFGLFDNGKIVSYHIGFVPEEQLFDYLQENGVINENETFISEYSNLNFIDINDYKKIVESGKKSLVVLAQHTCSACMSAKGYINELAKEKNVEINYFNLEFNTEDEYNYFYESNNFIKEKIDDSSLSTPTYLVIEGKNVNASLIGIESGKEGLADFIDKYLIGNEKQ